MKPKIEEVVIIKKYDIESLNQKYGLQVENEYLQGCTLQFLALKYFNDNTYIVKKILAYRGVQLRTRAEIKHLLDRSLTNNFNNRKYEVDKDYFKKWSHDMAYILGFIAADGNISHSYLTIGLQKQDEEILEKIKNKLNYSGNIRYSQSTCQKKHFNTSVLNISSVTLCEDLKKIGIMERKSLLLQDFSFVPEQYEIDFIRGYFDGDGTVGTNYPINSKKVRSNVIQIRTRIVSGSFKLITYIKNTFVKYNLTNVKVNKKGSNLYEICYSTKDSIKIFELFYGQNNYSPMYLERKYQKFLKGILQRKEDICKSQGYIKIK